MAENARLIRLEEVMKNLSKSFHDYSLTHTADDNTRFTRIFDYMEKESIKMEVRLDKIYDKLEALQMKSNYTDNIFTFSKHAVSAAWAVMAVWASYYLGHKF